MEGANARIGTGSRFRVLAMSQIGNAPAIVSDRNSGENWVRFGRHNLFPEFVRGLADNCAPLDACVETMAQYIAGNGFEFLDANDKPMAEAERKWEELCGEDGPDAMIERLALDAALMNSHSLEVLYNGAGMPALLNHLDVCRIRSGKKGEDGKVKEFYFSSNWERRTEPGYRPIQIPAWGEDGPRKLIYRKGYKNLRDYYGEPHWLAVMADAEVLTRIPVFNRTQIDTGFRPATWLHFESNQDAADTDEIDEKMELAFTGESGKTYLVTASAVNEKMTITKLERGDHAGELDKTRAVSKEEIYHSYGIPPVLMGVNINTGLSGKGLAIEETLSMFMTMKVAPKQKPIARTAKIILAACGIDVPYVGIKHRVPFEPAKDPVLQRQTYIARTTVDEDRIANDLEPRNDEKGGMLICEVLKGSGANDSTDQIGGPDA